jgi:Flp pilus assembly protein TadG
MKNETRAEAWNPRARRTRQGMARWRLSQWGLGDEHGSSLVELALVFPIFILLLAGAAEFGRLAYDAIEVSNAAYAGAIYGAQSHATAVDTTNIELAATNDAADVTGVSATAVTFCTCSSGTTITCSNTASCNSPDRVLEFVQVNTIATVNPLFHYPGIATTFTLHGQSILRVEQ